MHEEDKITMRPATETMTLTDGRGNTVHREVKLTLDIRDYEGTAGFPWVLVAANRHLSQEDITLYLERKAVETPGVARTRSWVQRRAWMFRPRGSSERRGGPIPNRDGRDGRAFELMAAHPKLSLTELSRMLKEHGIKRSKEWCRTHRCDGM